jgi:putative ubiquitin-RnfH superfamily antitoxin RatB of RatAB toxin-antitoxin module
MAEALIRVTVAVSSGPRMVDESVLEIADGATVQQALLASGRCALNDLQASAIGVWGRAAGLGQRLRDLDRVEVYRPLIVDPKVARRERFQKQGTRSAGLFAKKRAGAKAGY